MWVVRIRFYLSLFLRVISMQVARPPNSSGNVYVTKWNLYIHQNLVHEAAYMEANPESPTLVMVSLGNRQYHDTCPCFSVLKLGGICLKTSGCDRLQMLVMYQDHLLASKNHNNFNLRNEITNKITVFLMSIFLHVNILHRLTLLQIWRVIS